MPNSITYSAAIRRGLIEAGGGGKMTSYTPMYSAAIRRGLIEATIRDKPVYLVCSIPRRFAAASLKPGKGQTMNNKKLGVFRGDSPRPH